MTNEDALRELVAILRTATEIHLATHCTECAKQVVSEHDQQAAQDAGPDRAIATPS